MQDTANSQRPERCVTPPWAPFTRQGWLRPAICDGGAHRLAGGWARFDDIDLVQRGDDGAYFVSRMALDALLAAADDRNLASAAIERLTSPRPDFAGLGMARPRIMGILNVTPDSFSDGGRHGAPARAIAAGKAMIEAGADIIDIGGESTRPGADEVSCNQELARVLPPLAGLAGAGAVISVDTRKAEVMTRAAARGAAIINDVGALRGDGAPEAAGKTGAAVILMHMKGEPKSMQRDPVYGFAPVEIYEFLESRIEAAMAAGIPRARLAIDPGYGFGKALGHNLDIVNWASMFHGLGVPVMIGASRKSSIAAMSRGEAAQDRLAGSLVLGARALDQGCQMLRVHDVAETRQGVAVHMALDGASAADTAGSTTAGDTAGAAAGTEGR